MICTYAAHKTPISEIGPTQTESEEFKKNIPSKWAGVKRWSSNTYIRQNRLKNKSHKKTHRKTLHNTQRKNPLRRHNNCKHICTQQRNTQIYKENLRGLQERHRQQTLILGDFNTHCQQ